ncbi:hypothetical protein DEH81_00865 [Pectobacterium zantedeschiae]|nr:hypothetical protein DEH81_00865 [Pectobacterium zantedeschiae]
MYGLLREITCGFLSNNVRKRACCRVFGSKNDLELPQESLSQLGACLNATVHLIPALLEMCEQAERHVRTVTTVNDAPLTTQ